MTTRVDLTGIDTVIFDKDGTLIDFHAMWGGWARGLGERLDTTIRRPVSLDVFAAIGFDPATGRVALGRPVGDGHHGRHRGDCRPRAASLVPEHRGRATGDRGSLVRAGPGRRWRARSRTCRRSSVGSAQRGRRIAVVTTDDRAPTDATLRALGVRDCVEAMVCGDDGFVIKPEPDPVFAVCQAFRRSPARVAVIGDTPADIAMGRSAGAGLVVGVRSGLGSEPTSRPPMSSSTRSGSLIAPSRGRRYRWAIAPHGTGPYRANCRPRCGRRAPAPCLEVVARSVCPSSKTDPRLLGDPRRPGARPPRPAATPDPRYEPTPAARSHRPDPRGRPGPDRREGQRATRPDRTVRRHHRRGVLTVRRRSRRSVDIRSGPTPTPLRLAAQRGLSQVIIDAIDRRCRSTRRRPGWTRSGTRRVRVLDRAMRATTPALRGRLPSDRCRVDLLRPARLRRRAARPARAVPPRGVRVDAPRTRPGPRVRRPDGDGDRQRPTGRVAPHASRSG